jgi:hypothetical protein
MKMPWLDPTCHLLDIFLDFGTLSRVARGHVYQTRVCDMGEPGVMGVFTFATIWLRDASFLQFVL